MDPRTIAFKLKLFSENNHHWGQDACTIGLQFNKTRPRNKICCFLYVGSEAAEYKFVKLETRCTVILPPAVRIL